MVSRLTGAWEPITLPTFKAQEEKKTEEEEEEEEEQEGTTCSICLEPWSNQGNHRITATKCGHLFGRECIKRWLKSHSSCPTCKKRAKPGDLRSLYIANISVVDNAERERSLALARKYKKQITTLSKDLGRVQVSNTSLTASLAERDAKIADLHRQLQVLVTENRALKSHMSATSANGILPPPPPAAQTERGSTPAYTPLLDIPLAWGAQAIKARVMDVNQSADAVVVGGRLGSGFGLARISLADSRHVQTYGGHSKSVRDVAFGLDDSAVLSVGFDRKAVLTSLETASPLAEIPLASTGWSCGWHPSEESYFFVGLGDGTVAIYDIRSPSSAVATLSLRSSQPIHSLAFTRTKDALDMLVVATCSAGVHGFPITGTLSDTSVALMGTPISAEPSSVVTSLAADPVSSSLLFSYRPPASASGPSGFHEIGNLTPGSGWSVTTSLGSVSRQRIMSQSSLFTWPLSRAGGRTPRSHLRALVGDEDSCSAVMWNVALQAPIHHFPSHPTPILDTCVFHSSTPDSDLSSFSSHHVALLSESSLKLYTSQ